MEEYQRQRDEFWERYQEEFRRIRRAHPGFWRELRELGGRHHAAQYTTRGAQVCAWPQSTDAATQTGGAYPRGQRSVRDASTQTDPVLQVGPTLEQWLKAHPAKAAPAPVAPGKREACWSCDEPGHRYSDCRRPRYRLFCFGCGRPDVTIKDCERCGEGWRRAGPYRPDQGRDRRGQ